VLGTLFAHFKKYKGLITSKLIFSMEQSAKKPLYIEWEMCTASMVKSRIRQSVESVLKEATMFATKMFTVLL
jgi:hypothetical protein